MQTIYQINTDDLDNTLLESIKLQFKHKKIEIFVSEIDETEYLMRSPANREYLLRVVQDVENNQNLITRLIRFPVRKCALDFLGTMQKPARSKGEISHLLRACFRIIA